ncbi:MAG TPA: hypothetical protein VE961_23460 [Pyrinomonadaceae bacterium]|nr:hypothetical protein [Pyrinomonadaceae bacterium]
MLFQRTKRISKPAAMVLGWSLLLLTASCSNSLFKVKAPSAMPVMPASAASMNVGSLSFRAAPLLTDEETQELFESNLQLAGLLPVRLEVVHNSGEAVEIKKLKFRLSDSANSEWKQISAKQAISRIIKANGLTLYNPNARKQFEKEFRAYEFNLKDPLTHAEGKRQGLLIFQSAKKDPVASPKDLALAIEGLAQPVSLKLN